MNRPAPASVRHLELGTVRRPGPGAGARRRAEAGIDGSWWRWLRPLGGATILGVVVATLGGGPVVDALRATDGTALAMGAGVAVLTTVAAAWRWRLVAGRLEAGLTLPSAVAACYRSQFLNVTLPGGVLGDVGRGVHHGHQVHDVGRGLRTVAWERASGQVVLVLITVSVLLVTRPFAAPGIGSPGWALLAVAALACGVALSARGGGQGIVGRVGRVVMADGRALLGPTASGGIALASLAVVGGHVATFVIAARAVGVGLPVVELLPIALLVLLVSGVPLNLAGWGPREGAAAWAFGAAGLGAGQGLSVAVAYGAIVFVATLPGAMLLLVGPARRSTPRMPPGTGPRRRAGSPSVGDAVGGTARG